MDQYIRELQDRLQKDPPNYGHAETSSLLRMLSDSYLSYNPVDNQQIREKIYELEPIMNILDRNMADMLFETVVSLCEAYEQQAFESGLKLGLQLMKEITG